MDQDPSDPGFEPVRLPELGELPPGRDEGVLQGVLGQSGIAQDPEGDREQRIADLMHQDSERVTVTPTGEFDEVLVHLGLSCAHLVGARLPL